MPPTVTPIVSFFFLLLLMLFIITAAISFFQRYWSDIHDKLEEMVEEHGLNSCTLTIIDDWYACGIGFINCDCGVQCFVW